jgi:hypothetical protein
VGSAEEAGTIIIMFCDIMNNITKYVYGTNESLVLSHLLLGVMIIQYNQTKGTLTGLQFAESVLVGAYLADLLSGSLHLYFDRCENSSVVAGDPSLRNHHINPKSVLSVSTMKLLQQTAISPVPLFAVLYNYTTNASKSVILTQLATFYIVHMGQITHQLAHWANHATKQQKKPMNDQMVRFLQTNRIILSAEEHRAHHLDHKINFCTVNGWANPLLNTVTKFLI